MVSQVKMTLTATDEMSGVKSMSWRVDDGDIYAYDIIDRPSARTVSVVKYPAIDKAGVREAWKSITFKIESKMTTVTVAYDDGAGRPPGCGGTGSGDQRRRRELGVALEDSSQWMAAIRRRPRPRRSSSTARTATRSSSG